MKRDFDLIRMILKDVEEMASGHQISEFTYPDIDGEIIREHVVLLLQAGLLNGTIIEFVSEPNRGIVTGLTWAGHDFLGSIKDDNLWKQAKDTVIKPAGGVAFAVLLEWVKAEALRRLNGA